MFCHASCVLFGLPLTCIYSKPSWACSTNRNNHTCLSRWCEPMPSLRIDDINRPFWTFSISILYIHNISLPASRSQCIFHQLTGLVTLSPELLNPGLSGNTTSALPLLTAAGLAHCCMHAFLFCGEDESRRCMPLSYLPIKSEEDTVKC